MAFSHFLLCRGISGRARGKRPYPIGLLALTNRTEDRTWPVLDVEVPERRRRPLTRRSREHADDVGAACVPALAGAVLLTRSCSRWDLASAAKACRLVAERGRRRRACQRGLRRSGRTVPGGTIGPGAWMYPQHTMMREVARSARCMAFSQPGILSLQAEPGNEEANMTGGSGPGQVECCRMPRQDARRLQWREDRQAPGRLR
jgi:hypothetical protein